MNTEPLTITIPDHRPVSKNVGRRQHWAAKRRVKSDIYYAVRQALPECITDSQDRPYVQGAADICFVSYQKGRRQDSDNIDPKDYVDALRTYGVIEDDDDRFVTRVSTEVRPSEDKTDYMTIEIMQATKETA